MGKVGRGAVAYLGLTEEADKIMEDLFERISHPALTDLQVDWGALQASEVFPTKMPDLFVGRPVIVTGRFSGSENSTLRFTGNAAGEPVDITFPADASASSANREGLPSIWARMKIAHLADQSLAGPNENLPEKIKQVALDYGLMSAFTAFIAVDATARTPGTSGVTVPVPVPVPVPEGVNYNTTVQEN
jgi:Ca-activated chloride channel family protein